MRGVWLMTMQQYTVIKINKYGKKQERVMGIDRERITNSMPVNKPNKTNRVSLISLTPLPIFLLFFILFSIQLMTSLPACKIDHRHYSSVYT